MAQFQRSSITFMTVLFITIVQLSSSQPLPRFGDLDCISDFFPFTCTGDLCFTSRYSFGGQVVTFRGCLIKSFNPHWRDVCDGLTDSSQSVSHCCTENDCNKHLSPRLPSDPEGPTDIPPYRPINDDTDDRASENLLACTFNATGVPLNGHPGFCYGDACVTVHYIDPQVEGGIGMMFGCLSNNLQQDLDSKCNGELNTDTTVYECCTEGDRCNDDLHPLLPAAPEGSGTGSGSEDMNIQPTAAGDPKTPSQRRRRRRRTFVY